MLTKSIKYTSQNSVPFVRSALSSRTTRTITYHLPNELVAIHPAETREGSRLLSILPKQKPTSTTKHKLYDHAKSVYTSFDTCPTKFGDFQFQDIIRLLPSGCHIVHNESKVLQARLLVRPPSAAPFEMLLLSPADDLADPNVLTRTDANGQLWRTMLRNDQVQVGDVLQLEIQHQESDASTSTSTLQSVRITCIHSPWIEEDENDGVEADVEFITASPSSPSSSSSSSSPSPPTMKDILDTYGVTPIPPYFNRDTDDSDSERYQTVFAKTYGSVAAPTASLHFSKDLLQKMEQKHLLTKCVLHVGAGTFKPVHEDGIESHEMHRESFEITKASLDSLISSLKTETPIIPVGTTSVRVLESLYWIGARTILNGTTGNNNTLGQWEPNEIIQMYSDANQYLPLPARALSSLMWEVPITVDNDFCLKGTTEICISTAAEYEFQICDALITNFHQSGSTLMDLTSAVLGGDERLLEAYDHAIANKYRFLSYGDCCYMILAK